MENASADINKLVSLTFDESPKVRKEAARVLADIDDPAAIFALMELSYDKDVAVKKLAQDLLEKKKSSSQDVMSFAEIFSKGSVSTGTEAKSDEEKSANRARVLEPITRIFERKLGKERATAVKNRMMPTIEKVYMKVTGANKHEENENGRKTMQEFLTSYLEAISGLPKLPLSEETVMREEKTQGHILQPSIAEEIGELGTKEKEVSLIAREIREMEENELVEEKQDETLGELPKSIFQRAYETMLASNGDEIIMKRDMKRLLRDAEKDIKTAYSLARNRFKENKITQLSKIKKRMRNINTETLSVKAIENFTYPEGKETKKVTRLLVNDYEGNEGVVYLFDNRGAGMQDGMKIRVLGGYAKTFDFSSETAIAITQKGNVYIVL